MLDADVNVPAPAAAIKDLSSPYEGYMAAAGAYELAAASSPLPQEAMARAYELAAAAGGYGAHVRSSPPYTRSIAPFAARTNNSEGGRICKITEV